MLYLIIPKKKPQKTKKTKTNTHKTKLDKFLPNLESTFKIL